MNFRIAPFPVADAPMREAAAAVLYEEARAFWPAAWPTLDAARAEVDDALAADKLALAAVDDAGALLGWVGAQSHYDGNVWELHPLMVRGATQRHGIGRALVEAVVAEVARRGALTIWVGTDDEAGLTSLGGVDVYPGVLDRLAGIRNLHRHPMGFYERLGFEVVGLMPDANGFGKPDIFMARRVRS